MLISVIIPCLNEAKTLRLLLDALRAQDTALHEVIVVDNGSTDGSLDIVDQYRRAPLPWPLRAVACTTPGAAAAMNAGIREAAGEVIVRLDGHCLPREDYVRSSAQRLQDEGAGVVGGAWEIAPGRKSQVGRAIADVLTHPLATGGVAYRHPGHITGPTPVDTVPFGCFRKSLWQQIGGYDERLTVNEDYVFNYRTRLAGLNVVLDPTIHSTYYARGTFSQLGAQYFQYGWRKAEMLKTYPRSIRLRQVVPAAFVAGVAGLALLGLFTRVAWEALGAVLLLYAVAVLGAAVQLAWSRRAWRTLPAYVGALCVVQLAWGVGACVNIITFGRWPGSSTLNSPLRSTSSE